MTILVSLGIESARLGRIKRALVLRIGVTGTRGKSSVTRLIAAALRGAGYRVVAKTTGSRPMLIHVDGSEELLDRAGSPSILEQKKLLFLARDEGADTVVSEIMSILPENQAVESAKILELNVCVITNVRVDHEGEQGSSKPEVARSLSSSVPDGGVLVCAAGADLPELRVVAARKGIELRVAPPSLPEALRGKMPRLAYEEFDENLATALETCLALGLDGQQALFSMADAVPDLGALRAWSWVDEGSGATVRFTNAFAANDVESSMAVLERIASQPDAASATPLVGILNLRADRGERTRQWLRALRGGLPPGLAAMHVTGLHAKLVRRRLRAAGVRCGAGSDRDPAALFRGLLESYPDGFHALGLGNMAGPGAAIVAWCAGRGKPDAR
jgi:poly-gamma-glutamate synthase PgsB/CapB